MWSLLADVCHGMSGRPVTFLSPKHVCTKNRTPIVHAAVRFNLARCALTLLPGGQPYALATVALAVRASRLSKQVVSRLLFTRLVKKIWTHINNSDRNSDISVFIGAAYAGTTLILPPPRYFYHPPPAGQGLRARHDRDSSPSFQVGPANFRLPPSL